MLKQGTSAQQSIIIDRTREETNVVVDTSKEQATLSLIGPRHDITIDDN
jgi:hypothetical protein